MKDVVEIERVTQEELTDDLDALFRGALRTPMDIVEEELKAYPAEPEPAESR